MSSSLFYIENMRKEEWALFGTAYSRMSEI